MDEEKVERLAQLFGAMAEPARLRILGVLAGGEATGTELSDKLGLTPATISHHMARLVAAGIVAVRAEAQRRFYRLDHAALRSPLMGERRGPAASDDEKTLRDFFAGERLKQIPASRKKRVVVLRRLVIRFIPGQTYTEREVNDLLRPAHDDVATLRRELVDYGFMNRPDGVYSVADKPPERGATVAQETGPDEAAWFASLVANATNRVLSSNN